MTNTLSLTKRLKHPHTHPHTQQHPPKHSLPLDTDSWTFVGAGDPASSPPPINSLVTRVQKKNPPISLKLLTNNFSSHFKVKLADFFSTLGTNGFGIDHWFFKV